MKKILLFVFVTVMTFGLSAQVDRELVLLEIGTGTWCGYCPGAAMGADDLVANGDPVMVIENHNGDVFANDYSNARNSYYNISGYPTAQFDGSYNQVVGGSATQSMYGTYLPIVNARMGIQMPFTVEITGGNTGDNYDVTVTVTKVDNSWSGNNLKVRLAITESEIAYNWQNQTHCNFVNRLMVPDADGTTIDFTSGNTQVVNLSFTFDNSWDENHCEIVAFVQTDAGKENISGDMTHILDLAGGADPLTADFVATETQICESGFAWFESTSLGEPVEFEWLFPGGNPATSMEEDPFSYYENPGEYDVTLIVRDALGNRDTTTKAAYIQVTTPPDVVFGEVEDLCNEDWDPYELTTGTPYGGVYTGEFVSEGKYFHPTASGVGEFEVTYTYTDDACGAISVQQMVTVVNCVGLGENNQAIALDVFPNPTQGMVKLNIEADLFNTADLKVIDAMGKVVYEQGSIAVNGTYTTDIDLSDQTQGIYFVVVSGDDKQVTKKIFLKK